MATAQYTTRQLKELLTIHKVKGRSKATTLVDLIKICKQHRLIDVEEAQPLPYDVFETILTCAIQSMQSDIKKKFSLCKFNEYFQTFKNMARSCKLLCEILDTQWCDLLCIYAEYEHAHGREANEAKRLADNGKLTHIQALSLVVETGCQMCNAPRIRKVYWPYKRRICQQCLYANTVSDYALEQEYGLKKSDITGLPYNTREMYSRYASYFTLRFYWHSDVLNVYNKKYCKSIAKFSDIKDEQASCIKIRNESYAQSLGHQISLLMTTSPTFRALAEAKDPMMISVQEFLESYQDKITQEHTATCRKQTIRDWVNAWCVEKKHSSKKTQIYNIVHAKFAHKYARNTSTAWTKEWFFENHNDMLQAAIHDIQAAEKHKAEQKELQKERATQRAAAAATSSTHPCPFCATSEKRRFQVMGLIQHARAVHGKMEDDVRKLL
jgi:hypothetical protein